MSHSANKKVKPEDARTSICQNDHVVLSRRRRKGVSRRKDKFIDSHPRVEVWPLGLKYLIFEEERYDYR